MQSFMKFKAINIGCLSPRPSCSKGGQFYPPNKSLSSGFPNAYLLDSDLSSGLCYSKFEQPGLMGLALK